MAEPKSRRPWRLGGCARRSSVQRTESRALLRRASLLAAHKRRKAAMAGTAWPMISSGEDEQQQWRRGDVIVERQPLIQELRRWQQEAAGTALRRPAVKMAF
uniref:Uncharacterized protein n=1 Tax=Aegilops tauschii TaxID=37682 RepID=M8BE56_AEGTA